MVAIEPDYCHQCGAELDVREVHGRDRAWCPECEQPWFRNAVPCVCVLVFDGPRVLLVERSIPPVGRWELPGGHPEYDEKPEVAAARELEEEAGLAADPEDLSLLAVRHGPYRDLHYNVIGYAVDASDAYGDPEPGAEASEATFWSIEEIQGSEEAREIDRELLAAAIDSGEWP